MRVGVDVWVAVWFSGCVLVSGLEVLSVRA